MRTVPTHPTHGRTERLARFERLARSAHAPVLRYLIRRTDRETAADVLAETLAVLWRRLDEVPDDTALPWCYGVARRCLANAERGARRRAALVARILVLDPPPAIAASGDDEAADAVRAALLRLSPDERELLRLWAWEGLAPREIALVLGVSPNAVSIRLHRAKLRLREAMLGQDAAAAGHLLGEEGDTR